MASADRPATESTASVKRKLTAILHADAAGYSRLMNTDEDETYSRLMEYRAVIEDIVGQNGGRKVGTAGDAILADFTSVVEALSAARRIQETLSERNSALPVDRRLQFRIGINLGDVIVDGDDIFGDGVNVAARLETLAEPGGIAISEAVRDQIKGKLDLPLVDLGKVRVKNIDDPVHVFSVTADGGTSRGGRRAKFRNRIVFVGAALTIALMIAGVAWFYGGVGGPSADRNLAGADSGAAQSPVRASKPTVAILPFEDLGKDQTKSYFSDGITADVITYLGRFSDLLVLSWNAVKPYKGKEIAPEQLSRDLKVRYIVGGTVRRSEDRMRLTVQLTDAERGVLLWSDKFDIDVHDIFEVEDRISSEIVGALSIRLTRLERERVFKKPTDVLDAYEFVLRGRDLMHRVNRNANLEARGMFQKAIAMDPRYVGAYVELGWSHMNEFFFGWTEWPDRALERAKEYAEQALQLDSGHAGGHILIASVLTLQRRFDQARVEVARALELNPNNALAHAMNGDLTLFSVSPEAAVSSLELAFRLDPQPLSWWVVELGACYYFLYRYEDAVALLDRYQNRYDEDPTLYAFLAASLAQLGQHQRAAKALDRLRRISPFFDAKIVAETYPNPEHGQRFLQGLQMAGLQ